ncbi:retinoid-inducible serine carboxypeptidase-like [Anopheles nili]|uniref:retinoid-inducible serine carboxypeptidase-like n=1 Tax=Anopheles nili TaxID=185578 RepID=UPI00237C1ECF|nr:retinoid-inducible serine carboxypeptidase-like [Anopheles nili]
MSWRKKIICLSILFAFVAAHTGFGPGKQNWGYSEVRPKAFIFWWLHRAQNTVPIPEHYGDRPLILWLQGGPGGSSSGFGNFEEIGPLDRTLKPRQHAWVKDYNVLFVDSPVGSGFSYVEDRSMLARNSTTVVADLLQLLKDFYSTTGWDERIPLYIASESYGGRIAVELAYALVQENRMGTMECKIAGLFLGSAWISPLDSIAAWPDFLLATGHLDRTGHERISQRVASIRENMTQNQPGLAMSGWHALQQTVIRETGGINCYNILQPTRKEESPMGGESDEVLEYGETFWWTDTDTGPPMSGKSRSLEQLMRGLVQQTLGIEDKPAWGSQSSAVFDALSDDFLQASVRTVERLLNETTVELVLYNGQLDLITCTSGTFAWVDRLFEGIDPPHREPLVGEGAIIEGYRSEYTPRFTVYTVLRAGHMVPADNPSAVAQILREHSRGLP